MSIIKSITMDQGTDFIWTFFVEVLTNPALPYDCETNPYIPLDLSSYTATFIMAADHFSTPLITLTSAGGAIVLGTDGSVQVTFVPSDTSSIVITEEQFIGVYELQINQSTLVRRPVNGPFIINPELL